jgi:hypothetical protein
MATLRQIDGVGAVFVDDAGRVRICVSDSCAEAFDAAMASGITADELVEALLTQAEAGRVEADRIADKQRAEDASMAVCCPTNDSCERHRLN